VTVGQTIAGDPSASRPRAARTTPRSSSAPPTRPKRTISSARGAESTGDAGSRRSRPRDGCDAGSGARTRRRRRRRERTGAGERSGSSRPRTNAASSNNDRASRCRPPIRSTDSRTRHASTHRGRAIPTQRAKRSRTPPMATRQLRCGRSPCDRLAGCTRRGRSRRSGRRRRVVDRTHATAVRHARRPLCDARRLRRRARGPGPNRTGHGNGARDGHDVREAALDAWREHGRRAHAALADASTGRYDGLFVVGIDDGPVEAVAQMRQPTGRRNRPFSPSGDTVPRAIGRSPMTKQRGAAIATRDADPPVRPSRGVARELETGATDADSETFCRRRHCRRVRRRPPTRLPSIRPGRGRIGDHRGSEGVPMSRRATIRTDHEDAALIARALSRTTPTRCRRPSSATVETTNADDDETTADAAGDRRQRTRPTGRRARSSRGSTARRRAAFDRRSTTTSSTSRSPRST